MLYDIYQRRYRWEGRTRVAWITWSAGGHWWRGRDWCHLPM
ncbi:MAG: hypothetical protein ACLGJB_06800 [Blastocatellia bacterium]